MSTGNPINNVNKIIYIIFKQNLINSFEFNTIFTFAIMNTPPITNCNLITKPMPFMFKNIIIYHIHNMN